MRAAVFVALVAFAVYVGSLRTIVSVDASTNVLLAYSLVHDGDPYLDEFAPTYDRISYWSYRTGGHEVPRFPPGAAMLASPIVALGSALGIDPPATASVTLVGKIAAALMAAASVGAVHLAAALLAGRRIATVTAALYAFGTLTWPISAGALWQHGAAQLWVAVGLVLLLRRDALSAPRSGLAFGLAAITRPTTALFGLAAFAHLLRRGAGPALRAALWTLPAAVLLVAYDLVALGSVLTPYWDPRPIGGALIGVSDELARPDPLVALAGELVSPSRGLFVFSPFLLLGAYELVRGARQHGRVASVLRWQLAAVVLTLLLFASYVEWWAGYSYGERYLAETLPILSMGVALWLRRHRRSRLAPAATVALGAPAIAIAAIGAALYDWTTWSWERSLSVPADVLMWRIDLAQPWWTLTHTTHATDPLALITFAALAVGLGLLGLTVRRSSRARAPSLSPD